MDIVEVKREPATASEGSCYKSGRAPYAMLNLKGFAGFGAGAAVIED
jgi:hypothetical protein